MRNLSSAVAAAVLLAAPFSASAEDSKLSTGGETPIFSALEAYKGMGVTLHLDSGQELGGTVAEVSPDAVKLSQITGKEFYDALVAVDRIAAVIVRAK